MKRHSTVDRPIWDFLALLTRTTSLYWSQQNEALEPRTVSVRWDSDLNRVAGDLSITHIHALEALKRFEGCFVELRHLNTTDVLVFEGLSGKMAVAYSRIELNNADLDKELTHRWFSYRFELNNCQIHITNQDILPVLTVVGLSGKKKALA